MRHRCLQAPVVDTVLVASPKAGGPEAVRLFNERINGRRISFQGDVVAQIPCGPTHPGCSGTLDGKLGSMVSLGCGLAGSSPPGATPACLACLPAAFPAHHANEERHQTCACNPARLQLQLMQLKGVETDQGGTVAEWEYESVGGQLTLTNDDMPQVWA